MTEFRFHRFLTDAHFAECFEMQKAIWGKDFVDCVPPAIQKVAVKLGGVAAGAFDANGRMCAFVFGLTGVENNEIVHWSDMLAALPEFRDRKLGRTLKWLQRGYAAEVGARRILWTYDPLVAKNAHLNFNGLGAGVRQYVIDMYGSAGETSVFAQGIGTDRFIVDWPIHDERIGEAARAFARGERYEFFAPGSLANAPIVNVRESGGIVTPIECGADFPVPARVEIPASIADEQAKGRGALWRRSTRSVFQELAPRHLTVKGFAIERSSGRAFYYVVTKS